MLERIAFVLAVLVLIAVSAHAQFNNGGGGAGIGVGHVLTNGAPANPTGNSTVTPLMMGLGTTCKITPIISTRVLFQIQGNAINATAGNGTTVGLRTGTGTAPTNGAAVTGTLQTNTTTSNAPSTGGATEFNHMTIVSGLTQNTAYWFDMQVQSSTTTAATITNITCQAAEL